jgi:hypothetical protein
MPVGAAMEAVWGLRVGAALEATWRAAGVGRQLACPFALRGPVGAGLAAAWSMTTAVARAMAAPWALRAGDQAAAACRAVWAMPLGPEETLLEATVSVNRQEIACHGLTLSGDIDSYCIQATLDVAELEGWLLCEPGADLMVATGGETFALVVDVRARDRQFGALSLRVEARSPASRLEEPHAEPVSETWTDTTAKTIAQALCDDAGVALEWAVLDYPVAEYAADAASPLSILARLAEVVGGVVQSGHAGGVVIAYRYPVSPTQYGSAEPELVLSDADDLVLIREQYDHRPGCNSVLVMAAAEAGDVAVTIENLGEEDVEGQALGVFSWPWMDLQLQTSGGEDVVITDGGEQLLDVEELVEIVQGTGGLSRVPDQLLEWAWQHDDLGEITLDGTEVRAAAGGQGLLAIAYQVRYRRWLVTGPAESIQFWTEISDEAAEAVLIDAGLAVEVARAPGDRPATSEISDELLSSEAAGTARGRAYLDDQGSAKLLYTMETPWPRSLPLPGAVVEVQDASLGETWRGRLTGWAVSVAWGEDVDATLRVDVERSLT